MPILYRILPNPPPGSFVALPTPEGAEPRTVACRRPPLQAMGGP